MSADASEMPLDDQRAAFKFFLDMMHFIRGGTARDVNRAVYFGAVMLGVRYERLHRMMKVAAVKGAAAAVADSPNVITRFSGYGYVYFALDDTRERLKIGYSKDPTVRIAAVSRHTGVRLSELMRYPGYPINEQATHVAARPALLGGEWYDFDQLTRLEDFKFLAAVEAAKCAS